jgi:hypothetical protein
MKIATFFLLIILLFSNIAFSDEESTDSANEVKLHNEAVKIGIETWKELAKRHYEKSFGISLLLACGSEKDAELKQLELKREFHDDVRVLIESSITSGNLSHRDQQFLVMDVATSMWLGYIIGEQRTTKLWLNQFPADKRKILCFDAMTDLTKPQAKK